MYIGSVTGPAAFAPQAGAYHINSNKESQLHAYMPGMDSKVNYNPTGVQAVRLRADEHHSRAPVSERSYIGNYASPGATTACKQRLPELNTYSDPVVQEVHRKQLQSNPLWQPFPV